MSDLFNKNINTGKRRLKGLLSILLCLAVIASAIPFAFSASTESSSVTAETVKSYSSIANTLTKSVEAPANTFMLCVSTGNSSGEGITCFEVRYKSTSGSRVYSEFIFPDEGLRAAYAFGKSAGVNFGYERRKALLSYAEYTAETVNELFSMDPSQTALSKNTTDYLYFTTAYDFGSLVDIRVYGNYTQGAANSWAFTGLKLYMVKHNLGLVPVSNVSKECVALFDGTLIAENKSSGNCSWSGRDAMFVFSASKTDKFALSDTRKEYSAKSEFVIAEIDVADAISASLDMFATSYDANTLKKLTVGECMNLEISYADSLGISHVVNIPLVTSYFADLVASVGNDAKTNKIMGIFQQGDTIAFKAYLPGYASISKCRITYTKNTSDFSGKIFDLEISSLYSNRIATDESFSVSAIRIYDGSLYDISYAYDGSGYNPVLSDESANPIYACVSSSYAGNQVTLGSSAAVFTMNKYERGDKTKASIGSSTYLIAVTTDADVDTAGTTDDTYLTLNYKKTDGTAVVSDEYSIREQSNNYYGNWASQSVVVYRLVNSAGARNYYGALSRSGYYYNATPGKTLYFTVNLTGVSSFTGATLKIGGSDEWQISSFCIYQLASLSRRSVTWESGTVSGVYDPYGVHQFGLDRCVTREFDGIMCVQYEKNVLLQSGDSKTLSFADGGVAQEDADWGSYSYYMSYEDTKQNLGFTKVRCTYTVTVQVGDDAEGDSDCGSKNQFYFQLVFANGKSGYVLANQQLSSDGFRTGMPETFEISVNRDYGEVKAIHIIPQNPNDTDEVFDKLKIDYITVAKKEDSGVSLTYKVEINDWISIDYSDSAAQDSVSGQSGRSETDIARTYVVTGTGYSTNILVAVTTGAYNGSTQFTGHIFADIRYRDSNGVDQTKSGIDVTSLMYQYAGKSASSKIAVDGIEYAANDKAFMMREYHTDRFMVSIDDVSQIQSIQFYVYSNETGTWNISNVSMYLVEGSGQRTINSNQEYEVACEKNLLTSSDTDTFAVPFTQKTTYSTEIQLLDNTITVDESATGISAQVDYVPLSKDDTMNVYVYMSDDSTDVTNYDMKCAVSYAVNLGEAGSDTVTDKIYQKSLTLRTDGDNNMYYATGISASGLINVCSVSLKADTYSYVIAHVDRVVIEHVRSGVAIESFNIPMYNSAAYPLTLTGVPTGSSTTSTTCRQTVEFMLTDDTAKTILGYKVDDIAVAITYTALDGATTHKLTSPNVFLSETEQSIVGGGTVCTVNFNQSDVSSITGISFIAMGKLIGNAGIKNAYAANYTVDASGEETCLGWYSFGSGISTLSASSRTLSLTASSDEATSVSAISVSPVTVTVKTADAAKSSESGTNCPVRMEIGYTDNNGNTRYAVYSDINTYAVSGSTATGKTITLKMLINNLASVRSVEFKPYTKTASSTQASWTIDTVNMIYSTEGEETELTRAVGSTATESEPLSINLSKVSLSVRAFSHNSKTNASYNNVFSGTGEQSEGILISDTQTVTLTPSISGSAQGISCTCYKVVNGTDIAKDSVADIYGTSSNVKKVIFGDTSGIDAGTYKIVFKSVEFPDITMSINIIVEEEKTTAAETKEATTAEEETTEAPDVATERTSADTAGKKTTETTESTVTTEKTTEKATAKSSEESEKTTVEKSVESETTEQETSPTGYSHE